ncbi:peptidase M22 [Oscillospiraceae bacterium PP1C4]
MAYFLGLDTSNYTTSVALYDGERNEIAQNKKLLAVKDGSLGLRQSDAVFSHVKQLGELISDLMASRHSPLSGIGVSTRPRDVQNSYMPCFLVGELVAQSISAVSHLPITRVSHQSGHIAAALFSTGRLDLIGREFAAFHLSGGTTECLLVKPDAGTIFAVERIAQSLDLKAGQAVDRVGVMLGLPFPAGKHLEILALQSEKTYKIRPTFKGADCSLSGVENRCQKMCRDGETPCDVARYCIESILAVVDHMTAQIKDIYGDLPVVYSGGVMSNSIIRERITAQYGGYFAEPQFSSDNAAGVAILAQIAQAGGAPA